MHMSHLTSKLQLLPLQLTQMICGSRSMLLISVRQLGQVLQVLVLDEEEEDDSDIVLVVVAVSKIQVIQVQKHTLKSKSGTKITKKRLNVYKQCKY